MPVILRIKGDGGAHITQLSLVPYEEEVLFKPSTAFDFKGVEIALRPRDSQKFTEFNKYEIKSCDDSISESELSRLSHFRLNLVTRL